LQSIRYTSFADTLFYSDLKVGPIDIDVDDGGNFWMLCYVRNDTLPGINMEVRKYSKEGILNLSLSLPPELFLPNNAEIERGLSSHVIKPRINRVIISDNKVMVEGMFEGKKLETQEVEKRRYTIYTGQRVLSKQEILSSKESMLLKPIDFTHRGWFEHEDSERAKFYFTTFEVVGEENGWERKQGLILKYDKDGRLLAKIKFPLYIWGTVKQLYFDDKSESIYCLTNDENGIQLLRYTKIKVGER